MYYGFASPVIQTAPTPAVTCPADQAISAQSALLYSAQAPLAGQRATHCDFRAVWAFVPSPLTPPLSLLYYFHGNNNWVPATAAQPNGRRPAWTRNTPGPLTANGPVASGPKYQFDTAAQAAPGKPIVLAPEVGVPVTGKYWASAVPGAFPADPARLTNLTADCFSRLQALRGPTGAPLLGSGVSPSSIGRLYLAGHSGGERPLQGACRNTMARTVPGELWLYDCTYSAAYNQHYLNWVLHWFRFRPSPGAPPVNRLGNTRGRCRMMVFATGGVTTRNAMALLQSMQAAGIPTARVQEGRMVSRSGGAPAAPPLAVEVPAGTALNVITGLMSRVPIVFVHTGVAHDQIPRFWTPHLLATAPPA